MLTAVRRDPVPWVVRALWLSLPFTAGPGFAAALDSRSAAVQTLGSIGLWVGWGVAMVAVCAPLPVALTAFRFVAPGAAAAAVNMTVAGSAPADSGLLAVTFTVLCVAWASTSAFAEWFVNGPAYPNERRYLLRAPGTALGGLVAVWITWDVAAGGLTLGPLLLAVRQWVLGGIVTVVGVPVAVVALRSLHNLSRRWVVFVPAGVVLHDPITLRDPVLFVRRSIESMRPFAGGGGGGGGVADLRQRAPGPAVELRLHEPAPLTLMRFGQRLGDQVEASAVVFVPSRAAAVLAEGRTRRLPVER